MHLAKWLIVGCLCSVLACGGAATTPSSTPSTTSTAASRSEFRSLCRAIGAEGGKLSRDQFIAQAKDKNAAAEIFDACDTDKKGYLTEEDVRPQYMDNLKRQVIRLTEPGFQR